MLKLILHYLRILHIHFMQHLSKIQTIAYPMKKEISKKLNLWGKEWGETI